MDLFLAKAYAIELNFLEKGFYNQGAGQAGSFEAIITKVISSILVIAAALAIIYFLYSGILYITAAGNADNVKKGQQGLMYGAIGIIIIVISYYAVTAIASYASNNLGNPINNTQNQNTTPSNTDSTNNTTLPVNTENDVEIDPITQI